MTLLDYFLGGVVLAMADSQCRTVILGAWQLCTRQQRHLFWGQGLHAVRAVWKLWAVSRSGPKHGEGRGRPAGCQAQHASWLLCSLTYQVSTLQRP